MSTGLIIERPRLTANKYIFDDLDSEVNDLNFSRYLAKKKVNSDVTKKISENDEERSPVSPEVVTIVRFGFYESNSEKSFVGTMFGDIYRFTRSSVFRSTETFLDTEDFLFMKNHIWVTREEKDSVMMKIPRIELFEGKSVLFYQSLLFPDLEKSLNYLKKEIRIQISEYSITQEIVLDISKIVVTTENGVECSMQKCVFVEDEYPHYFFSLKKKGLKPSFEEIKKYLPDGICEERAKIVEYLYRNQDTLLQDLKVKDTLKASIDCSTSCIEEFFRVLETKKKFTQETLFSNENHSNVDFTREMEMFLGKIPEFTEDEMGEYVK